LTIRRRCRAMIDSSSTMSSRIGGVDMVMILGAHMARWFSR
jgi:hypothetical protein